jgi:RNA polymerase sigma-70 factor, ECF subfamily
MQRTADRRRRGPGVQHSGSRSRLVRHLRVVTPAKERSDDASFEAFVEELAGPIGRFLNQMTKDQALAADLMQETFLAAWRERTRIPREPSARRAWLYAIARNRALSALRKERRGIRARWQLVGRLEREPSSEADSEALAMRDLLVCTLTPSDRSLFVLRYVHGFDGGELAALTGLRPEAVRKRLQRASARLAIAYERAMQEEGKCVHVR